MLSKYKVMEFFENYLKAKNIKDKLFWLNQLKLTIDNEIEETIENYPIIDYG